MTQIPWLVFELFLCQRLWHVSILMLKVSYVGNFYSPLVVLPRIQGVGLCVDITFINPLFRE